MTEPRRSAEDELVRAKEAFLLSYVYRPRRRVFDFVCIALDQAPGSQRDFLGLSFVGVTGFVDVLGSHPGNREPLRFATFHGGPQVRLQHIDLRRAAKYLRLHFGPTYGDVCFSYRKAMARRRSSTVKEIDGKWVYRDLTTGRIFDMYRPFPALGA
jgi:hypothetical protein